MTAGEGSCCQWQLYYANGQNQAEHIVYSMAVDCLKA